MGFIGKTNSSVANKATPFSMADALPVQTKLTVSKASDPAEKEADATAQRVVNEQKDKKAASKKADDKKDTAAPAPTTEPTPEPKKEGVKTKADDKIDVQKMDSTKDEKKAAKKDDDKKDKVNKKDDKKQEAQKKSEEKEEKKVAKKEETGKDKKPVDQEKDMNAKPKSIHRKEAPAVQQKPAIQQKPQEKTPTTALGRKESGKDKNKDKNNDDNVENDEAKLQAVEQKINAKKGSGKPLNDQVRSEMEQSFKYDFSEVKIHDDKESSELCAALNAQAFAIGNDIFFNTGKYDPESDKGKELLAHELTHVVQQKDQVQRAIAYRNPVPTGNTTTPPETITLPSLEVPQFKDRHKEKFTKESTKRRKGYNKEMRASVTGGKKQAEVWENDPQIVDGVKNAVGSLKTRAAKNPDSSGSMIYYLKWKGIKLFGKEDNLIKNTKRPLWNYSGEVSAFDVDHIVELQMVGGTNTIDNMELLNFSGNRSSGSMIDNNISSAIENYVNQQKPGYTSAAAKKESFIAFEKILFTGKTEKSGKGSGKDGYWTKDQIIGGEHLKNFTAMSDREIKGITGKDGDPVAFTSPVGGAMLENKSLSRLPAFTGSINAKGPGGKLTGKFSPNEKVFDPLDISIDLEEMPGVSFGGSMKSSGNGSLTTILKNLKAKGLSPVEIDSADLIPNVGVVAKGRITPTVEIIKGLYIDFSIEGKNIVLSRTFRADDIQAIPPPLKVTEASLTVFANGGTSAIGITGKIDFEINKVGKGEISASGDSNGVFKLNGNFDFDEKLFGGVKANVKAGYEHTETGEDKWDVHGNIHIPSNKIKGIQKADINVNYADRIFKADGSATFDVPGLEDGKMSVTYGNDQLIIEGEANFKHKFIKSGKVSAKVETIGDKTSVSMSGNAKPNIPGIDSDLSVSYVDGVFMVTGTVGYAKGRLSGSATVGVTNQAVGADGKPSGGPGKDLKIFGSASLTLKITDWLQGTAGVTFKPDGQIEVVGKIGIPNAVDIFPKKEIKKDIFKAPTIEIPLFAIPVGSHSIGLVATIGGGAEAYASIGPGQLTEAAVEVKYNPAQEESMSVTGNAKFRVPAEAGLRLYVRAGIGLSIGIARVSGGIELSGALGIQGAAEAAVSVNWSPTQGFKLDAEAALSVQPKFKFDVNAYIEAVLDLWITEFSKEWKWNLYSFEWGPALKFGVKFPVHYEENKPFNISLDDVQFEAPDISVGDFAKGIGQQLLG